MYIGFLLVMSEANLWLQQSSGNCILFVPVCCVLCTFYSTAMNICLYFKTFDDNKIDLFVYSDGYGAHLILNSSLALGQTLSLQKLK